LKSSRNHICDSTFLVAGIAMLGICGGCAERPPETYSTTVTITYADNKPVVGAQVALRSDDGRFNARGTAGSDGSCRLTTFEPEDGAVLGHHTVIVAKPVLRGDPDVPYTGPRIASKYANLATSGLKITVTKDKTKNVFPLQVSAQ
jgi:hypothetical protein